MRLLFVVNELAASHSYYLHYCMYMMCSRVISARHRQTDGPRGGRGNNHASEGTNMGERLDHHKELLLDLVVFDLRFTGEVILTRAHHSIEFGFRLGWRHRSTCTVGKEPIELRCGLCVESSLVGN